MTILSVVSRWAILSVTRVAVTLWLVVFGGSSAVVATPAVDAAAIWFGDVVKMGCFYWMRLPIGLILFSFLLLPWCQEARKALDV